MLRDFLPALKLKRDLERGRRGDTDHPDVLARCAVADRATVAAAIEAAAAAAPAWAAVPLEKRMRLCHRLHEELGRRRGELVEVLVGEGHPRSLAEWEVSGLLQASSPETVGWLAGQLHQEFTVEDRRLAVTRKPDGVVALIPPQNAAAANSLMGFGALAAGNTLVVKAPRSAPHGVMHAWTTIVAPLLDEIGAPPGTLNIVCGHPKEVLDQLLDSPLVNDIVFFGGSEVGLQLGVDAMARGKKTVLELAGNDGVVVWRDADLAAAAEALTECFYGSGQICMVPKYVVAHPDIADELLARLTVLARRIRPGYPEDPDVLLTPVINTERYFAFLADATAKGATVFTGGRRLEVDGTPSPTGVFCEPTVLRVPSLAGARQLAAVAEETFFPMLPVVVGDPDLDTVLDFVNANAYGLRNSLWSRDRTVVDAFVGRVTNGGLLKVNDSHIGFLPYLPTHGGTGRTGGVFGEANYPMLRTTHLQGVSIRGL